MTTYDPTVTFTALKMDNFRLSCPFNVEFTKAIRKLKAKPTSLSGDWIFEGSQYNHVTDLTSHYFGTDGHMPPDVVTADLSFPDGLTVNRRELTVGGRPIVRVDGTAVVLGAGIALNSGDCRSLLHDGGKRMQYRLQFAPGTVVRIVDLARPLYIGTKMRKGSTLTLVSSPTTHAVERPQASVAERLREKVQPPRGPALSYAQIADNAEDIVLDHLHGRLQEARDRLERSTILVASLERQIRDARR